MLIYLHLLTNKFEWQTNEEKENFDIWILYIVQKYLCLYMYIYLSMKNVQKNYLNDIINYFLLLLWDPFAGRPGDQIVEERSRDVRGTSVKHVF